MRASYEEAKILLARRPIDQVVQSEDSDLESREKLNLVLSALNFADKAGFKRNGSFNSYVKLDREILAWVLAASEKTAFKFETWWFPFVGSVPYKGFFSKDAALEYAHALEKRGLETWVRSTDAFSTLGWFDDPLMSTTLSRRPVQVVQTVFHELFHSTVWVPGRVDFNESAANYIGLKTAEIFFAELFESCAGADQACLEAEQRAREAELTTLREIKISESMQELYQELDTLYSAADLAREQKLKQREEIFTRHMSGLRANFPELTVLRKINNAEIMQLRLYLVDLKAFHARFQACGEQISVFLVSMQGIAQQLKQDESLDPFELLKQSAC